MTRNCKLAILPIVIIFLVLSSAPAARATEAGPFYEGVFGGYVMPRDLELGDSNQDVKLKNSWMAGAKFGYIIPTFKWVAAEVEYFYLFKQDVDNEGNDGDFSAHNVMGNLLMRYPEGRFHPYAGLGVGWSWGKFKGNNNGFSFDETDGAFAWQILAGMNLEITPDWSADLGYKYFQSKYSVGSSPSVDVTSKNHIVFIGINYHFSVSWF